MTRPAPASASTAAPKTVRTITGLRPVSSRSLTLGAVLLMMSASPLAAQRMITAQAGVGAAIDKRNDRLDGTHRHAAIAIEVSPPLLPLGARVDGMWIDAGATGGTFAANVNAVYTIRLPVIRPYALAGWGQYGIGGSAPVSGINAGAGVKIQGGPIRLFGEVRRHWKLSRDLVTVGLSL